MDKGYLFVLIGAILAATLFVPLPVVVMYWWSRMTFWGYLLISFGMRSIPGSQKELKYAQLATLTTLAVQTLLSFGIGRSGILNIALIILQTFASMCIFFWLLKSEYMWSPSTSKKIDLLMYSIIAAIFLVLQVSLILAIFSAPHLRIFLLTLQNALQFVNILYYGILIFILAKLYLDARKTL